MGFMHILLLLIPLSLSLTLHLSVCEKFLVNVTRWIPRKLNSSAISSVHYCIWKLFHSVSMKARTGYSTSLKQEFLKKWINGLHIYSNLKKDMGILERKRAIKLSADVAIASTRNASTLWSRTLMANITKNETKESLVEQIFSDSEVNKKKASVRLMACSNRITSKKILRRSHITKIRARKMGLGPHAVKASSIAKKLVKNRTQVLKSLVPGGENMDEVSLIKETLDYIVSLRVQVDVMRCLASAAEHSTRSL